MESNLPLIIGLASGFAFLNFLLVFTWFLWERSRRRKSDQQRADSEDKLTSFTRRPTEQRKAKQLKPTVDPHPDSWYQYTRTGSVPHSSYISSPLPVHQSPTRNRVAHHNHPPGLSSLRNELYPSPPPTITTRRNSGKTFDTASVYSTISAPSHLHDEILSNTHESFSTTVVNSQDDHYTDDKYAQLHREYFESRDPRNPLYSIPEWESDVFDRDYSRCWSPYLTEDAKSPTSAMFRDESPFSNGTSRHGIIVSPLHITKRTPTPPFGAVREGPPARPPRCPSPHLPSPYSP